MCCMKPWSRSGSCLGSSGVAMAMGELTQEAYLKEVRPRGLTRERMVSKVHATVGLAVGLELLVAMLCVGLGSPEDLG